jgi:pimeloyl-ACP methyl ester carboxylesterase
MGGALALELAKRGRARSVVGISPAGGIAPGDRAAADRIIKVFKRMQNTTARSMAMLPRIVARPRLRQVAFRDVMTRGHQVPAAEALQMARSSIACAIVDDVYAVIRDDRAPVLDLDQITVPTLITWGSKDRILPMDSHAPRLRAEIPGVEFRIHPGIGHTPMWDDPGLIAATIGDHAAAAQARLDSSAPAPAAV